MSKGIAVIIWQCPDCNRMHATRDESDACCSQTLEQRVDAIEGWMRSLMAKPQHENQVKTHEHQCDSDLGHPGKPCYCLHCSQDFEP